MAVLPVAESVTAAETLHCLGPVARTCLFTLPAGFLNPNHYHEQFRAYLIELGQEIGSALFRVNCPSLAVAVSSWMSHKLTLIEPSENHLTHTPQIATQWIPYRVASMVDDRAKYCGY
ncbi:hypothetical protein HOY80DRAFT_974322 [Tuber brumale]|nr:hypothetical protein HOY80DRAFT_974322 [Tuber brumale]